MNVILAHMAFDNLNVIGLTDLAKQVSNTTRHILLKGLAAIFRAPDQIDFQVMSAVRSLALTSHSCPLLDNSNPRPKRRACYQARHRPENFTKSLGLKVHSFY